MKKITFILSFLLLSSLSYSQDKSSFGLKLGYINSWLAAPGFSSDVSFVKRSGISLGVLYNKEISKVFSFQPEILYSQKGYSYEGVTDAQGVPISYINYIDYIETPLLIKASLSGKVRPYLSTGFAPAININETQPANESFDIGFLGSMGFDIPVSENTKIFLELRVNTGLLKAQAGYNTGSFYVFAGASF